MSRRRDVSSRGRARFLEARTPHPGPLPRTTLYQKPSRIAGETERWPALIYSSSVCSVPPVQLLSGTAMLKRLELVGFKSFADERAFDFAAGHHRASSGPTAAARATSSTPSSGSSASRAPRACAAGEMTDVIFNGSGRGASLGMAEVTLTFDNADARARRRRRRGADHPPRLPQRRGRVPHQPAAVAGSRTSRTCSSAPGPGPSAYSIIEQGRVDQMLQANPATAGWSSKRRPASAASRTAASMPSGG